MPFHHTRLIGSALLAGLLALPGVALAQTAEPEAPAAEQQPAQQGEQQAPSQTAPQTGEQTEAAKPTDQQLGSFASATVRIVQIQEAAQKQMQEAVEKEGLTIDEYNRIAQLAQSDKKIEQALQEMIKSRIGG